MLLLLLVRFYPKSVKLVLSRHESEGVFDFFTFAAFVTCFLLLFVVVTRYIVQVHLTLLRHKRVPALLSLETPEIKRVFIIVASAVNPVFATEIRVANRR